MKKSSQSISSKPAKPAKTHTKKSFYMLDSANQLVLCTISTPTDEYRMVMLAQQVSVKANEEFETHKKLTVKEKAQLKADNKVKRSQLDLVTFPFQTIIPAPALGKKNPVSLCNYVALKFPLISAISEYATCTPSVASVSAIYTALVPLANIDPRRISTSDKTTRDNLTKSLRTQFLLMMQSCATLSVGNKALFQLTEVATKRTGTKHDGKPATPVFKIEYNKGRGTLGIKIDSIAYVKQYIIWYGKGTFDKATWNWQQGGVRQLIAELVPGDLINVFVIAKGTKKNSDPSNIQGGNVPFN